MTRPLTALVASDGSSKARTAVSLTVEWPWPDDSRVVGVVAAAVPPALGFGPLYRDLCVQSYRREAQRLHTVLRRRFSDPRVALVNREAVDAILAEQRRCRANVIIVGSRGLGALGRLALGSVSRRLVREAPCAVVVSRGRAHKVRRFLIAVDDSASSMHGVRLIGRLKATSGGRVRLVGVVPPVPVPLMGRAPASVRRDVARAVAAEQTRRVSAAQRRVDKAATHLRRAGWNVETEVRRGTPETEIVTAATAWRADVLVCGARNSRGLKRLLLGSVADGLLSRSPMSILIAK